MAKARRQTDGKPDKLDEAMSALIQSQANLLQNQAAFQGQLIDLERRNTERFARIEAILLEHSRVLADHSRIPADHGRILEALPDAVRDKTGFKTPESS